MLRTALVLGSAVYFFALPAAAQWDFSGSLELELRVFPQSAAHPGQEDATVSPSAAFQPELVYEWAEGDNRLTLEPYFRWDAYDDRRTHFDLREASFLHLGDSWDIVAGISQVFWGVTESVHLVDIINQTDTVEDIDSEDKLGQPMLNLNLLRDSGTYSFFVLPGFRKRTFPGDDARRRGPHEIEAHGETYDSGAEDAHIDFALRWSQTFGDWDIALSHFYGTSREARLMPISSSSGSISLLPHYDLINQSGVELQYTKGAWLVKLEGISRWGHGGQFFAAVGGFEFTVYQLFDSATDLGLLLEYQYDGRDEDGAAPFVVSDNDIFAGARLTFNNESSSALLAGLVVDVENGTTSGLLEVEHRLSEHWKTEIEARLFIHADESDPLFSIHRDDSINFKMTYSF